MEIVVVDTSIAFSAIQAPHSRARKVLVTSGNKFYAPNFLFLELFTHKEHLMKKSKASEETTLSFLNETLQRIHFINEGLISIESAFEAYYLCKEIDEKDTPFIALTLEMNGKLWTKDDELKEGLKRKGFDKFFEPE